MMKVDWRRLAKSASACGSAALAVSFLSTALVFAMYGYGWFGTRPMDSHASLSDYCFVWLLSASILFVGSILSNQIIWQLDYASTFKKVVPSVALQALSGSAGLSFIYYFASYCGEQDSCATGNHYFTVGPAIAGILIGAISGLIAWLIRRLDKDAKPLP